MSEQGTNRVNELYKSLFAFKDCETDRWLSSNMLLALSNPILTEKQRKEYLTDLITVYALFSEKRNKENK